MQSSSTALASYKYSILLLVLAIGLLLLVFYRIENYGLEKEAQRFLKITTTVYQGGNFVIYKDTGSGFTEADATRNYVREGPFLTDILLSVNEAEPYRLRIDPTDNISPFEIHSVAIVDGHHQILKSIPISDLLAAGLDFPFTVSEGKIVSLEERSNTDTQFLLNISAEDIPIYQTVEASVIWKELLLLCFFPICILLFSLKISRAVPYYLLLVFLYWYLFQPGFYSPDSIDQLLQAQRGEYWDQHPPVMSLILRVVFTVGFSLENIIFTQSVLGILGLRFLIHQILKCAGINESSRKKKVIITGVVIVILTLHWSPLVYYYNTLWKDTWMLILTPWLIGLTLDAFLRTTAPKYKHIFRSVFIIVLMLLIVAVRYNAIVLFPVFGLIVYFLVRNRLRLIRMTAGALFIAALFCLKPVTHKLLDVSEFFLQAQMYTMDLIGLYYLYPETADTILYTVESLKPDWKERFQWANVYLISFGSAENPAIVESDYGSYTQYNAKLEEEYFSALRAHPLKILHVKIRHFVELLGLEYTHYWFHSSIIPNAIDIHEINATRDLRNQIKWQSLSMLDTPARWMFGVHLVWLIINSGALLVGLWFWARQRTLSCLGCIIATSIPFIYYLSFIVSSPARDFRYLYPSSLIIQVSVLTLVGIILLRYSKSFQVSITNRLTMPRKNKKATIGQSR